MVTGIDVELQIAPCTPGQGHKEPLFGTVRQKFIEDAYDVFARDFIAIALHSLAVNERLCVGETNRALGSPAHRQFWVCGSQMGLVQQQTDTGMGRDFESGTGKVRRRLNSGCAHHPSNRCKFHLHGGERIRHQLPVVVLQYCSSLSGISNRNSLLPFAARRSCVIPRPIEYCTIDALRRFRHEVGPLNVRRRWQSLYALILFNLPTSVSISDTFLRRITSEHKCSSIADLSPGRNTQTPHRRSDLIMARTQKCRQIVRFVLPVRKITSCRSAPYLALVQAENE